MRLLVTRPGRAGEELARRLAAAGHEALREPLLDIELLAPAGLDVEGCAAIAVTSAHAIAAVRDAPPAARLRTLPIYCVGEVTSAAARDAGFADVRTGPGGAEALARLIAAERAGRDGALLYLSGADVAFDLAAALEPQGIAVRRVVVYRAVPAARLSEATRVALAGREIDAVVLMSARTAATYARLVAGAGLTDAVRMIAHICLSPAVAAPLRTLALNHVLAAARPETEEVLASVAFAAAKLPLRSSN